MDNNNINSQNISQEPEEQGINLGDLLHLCVDKWYWFVISVILVCALAVLYILRTPSTFSRSAELLIKDETSGNSIGGAMEQSFSDMGLFQTKSNVNDEVISLKSPALMYEVVKRLHLEMNYMTDGRFHKRTAYGMSLPINVQLLDMAENGSASFNLHTMETGKFTLDEFITYQSGEKIEHAFSIEGSMGDTLSTPAGRFVVTPTAYYSNQEKTYYINRTSILGAVNRYKAGLSVMRETKEASVIKISMNDVNIQRADDLINTLIAVYNENWMKDKNQIAVSTSMFINERLAVIENELGNVDENISAFKSKHLLPDVNAVSNIYLSQSAENNAQIMALNNQLYMARYIRSYLTDMSHKNQLLPANSGLESSNIENQIVAYNNQLLERNALVANSSEKNPLVVDMDRALASMRSAIIVSIDNQVETLNAQIKSLNKSEQQTTSKIASKPSESKFLISVERQQKVKESLYLYLLQKREENELSQAFTAYNSRIITPPTGSTSPIAPKSQMILLMAFVLGLAIPGGIIFVREITNTRLRGRKDLENLTVPFIGEIPYYRKKGLKDDKTMKMVVQPGSRDMINESFRVLRTNVEFMGQKDPKANVILFTSFNPDSGKSFLSMNLAMSLAIKKKKVLIIDGDLRHASVSQYARNTNDAARKLKAGMADYLGGLVSDYKDLIISHPEQKDLQLLSVGTIPPNPTELLYEPKFEALINEMRSQYDYIFIDCPPINLVADTQIIEKHADRTIFVVRAGLLDKSMLPELQKIYNEGQYKNMSMILNGTEAASHGYGKYGHYHYGYHYGYASYGYHSDSKKN